MQHNDTGQDTGQPAACVGQPPPKDLTRYKVAA